MKLKIYVHAKINGYDPDKVDYRIAECDMTEYWGACIFHGEVDLPFDPVTPAALIPGQVAILRKEQQKVRAEAETTVNRLEEQISKLSAIEWEGR